MYLSITQKHKFDYNVKRRPNVKTWGPALTREARQSVDGSVDVNVGVDAAARIVYNKICEKKRRNELSQAATLTLMPRLMPVKMCAHNTKITKHTFGSGKWSKSTAAAAAASRSSSSSTISQQQQQQCQRYNGR